LEWWWHCYDQEAEEVVEQKETPATQAVELLELLGCGLGRVVRRYEGWM
jgi:hypothetical protein